MKSKVGNEVTIKAQRSKRQEALVLFEKVVEALTGPDPNLVTCLRLCLRAAQLLEWTELSRWVAGELNGYPAGAELPNYRRAPASLEWTTYKRLDLIDLSVAEPAELQPRATTVPLWSPVADLLAVKERGYRNPTGETKEVYISFRKKFVVAEEVRIIKPIAIKRALDAIANRLYDLASRGSIVVRYGEAVSSSLENYIALVEDKLLSLGIEEYLLAAYRDLRHEDQASWQSAMMDCRNCLIQLASILWQPPQRAHPVLTDDEGQPMSLAPDKEKNRLRAYIHEKVASRSQRKYLMRQGERLTSLLYDLYELLSKAKSTATYEQALSALINTYVFLGDLAIHTDMEPVTEIKSTK